MREADWRPRKSTPYGSPPAGRTRNLTRATAPAAASAPVEMPTLDAIDTHRHSIQPSHRAVSRTQLGRESWGTGNRPEAVHDRSVSMAATWARWEPARCVRRRRHRDWWGLLIPHCGFVPEKQLLLCAGGDRPKDLTPRATVPRWRLPMPFPPETLVSPPPVGAHARSRPKPHPFNRASTIHNRATRIMMRRTHHPRN